MWGKLGQQEKGWHTALLPALQAIHRANLDLQTSFQNQTLLTIMNADILAPSVKDLFDFFNGQYRAKIECDYEINPDGSTSSLAYAFIGPVVAGDVFSGATIERAIERAKAEFKPVDSARLEAATKLREQADAILNGTAPIPAS